MGDSYANFEMEAKRLESDLNQSQAELARCGVEINRLKVEIKRLELALEEAREITSDKSEVLNAVRVVLVLVQRGARDIVQNSDAEAMAISFKAMSIANLVDGCIHIMNLARESSKELSDDR